MYRQLLFTVVFASFFLAICSIRCYEGYGRECIMGDDTKDCGGGAACLCIKFRYKCSQMDYGCNEKERLSGGYQWGFLISRKVDCEDMKKPESGYSNVTCCSTKNCNRPASGQCTNLVKH